MSRDAAIQQVEQAADAAWLLQAEAALNHLIKQRVEFSADDIWAQVEQPREPRALGAVLMRASVEGRIRKVRYAESRRSICHRRPIAIWKAL